jgi:hypothetical protein
MGIDPRRVLHIGVLMSVSTAAYALALAGVTTLQSTADRTLIAARAPVDRSVRDLALRHDLLERAVRDSTSRYAEIQDRYARLGPAIADLESNIGDLATVSQRITHSAAQLPTRVALPAVRVAPAAASAPRVHAVTSASGG